MCGPSFRVRPEADIQGRKNVVVVQPQQPRPNYSGKLKSIRIYIKVWGPLHNNYRR